MDNDNLFDKGNNSGAQPYQNTGGQYQQPYQNANGQYQQPYQNMGGQYQQQSYASGIEMEEPVSFGEWMLTLLLMYIPCVNLIVLFMWAFGSGSKKSKSNFAKANLVWMAIGIVLSIIMSFLYIGAIVALFDHGGRFY